MIVADGRSGAASSRASQTFTGEVWMDSVIANDTYVKVTNVIFQPRARTFWHSHEHGQLLHITIGSGLVCAKGELPVVIPEGSTIWVPPGEVHWHGGGADSLMAHTAVSFGRTDWMHEVTDEEYGTPA